MNVLAIGAHFDDVELGCGGVLAKHASAGDNVYVYVATVSGFSDHNNQAVRSNDLALREAQSAMGVLGVKELICGQFKTLAVEFVDSLNVEIIRIVIEKKIDIVYTHWIGDVHHDHQAVAKASLHSRTHRQEVDQFLQKRSRECWTTNWREVRRGVRGRQMAGFEWLN